jgi:hypothetical protein
VLWRCYSTQNRNSQQAHPKHFTFGHSSRDNSIALESLSHAASTVFQNRDHSERAFASSTGFSDGDSTVSNGSDDSELSDGEIAAQSQRNSALLHQYMNDSYMHESEIRFSDGPLDGEAITLVAPPNATLLHMPEEGDVDGPEDLQFQPCLVRDVGLFFDIWVIISSRSSELGQSRFDPGDLIEATCARHATLLLSETCVSLLFIAAIESERSGRGQFLNDVRYLSILTWQEHVRRLFESKGASSSIDPSRRRSGGAEVEGNYVVEEMMTQIATRDFHVMDVDCKVTLLRCLLLACTQPGVSLQKVELKSSVSDPRPKRQAAKSCMAGLDAMILPDRDAKRKKTGSEISEAIDSSLLSTRHLLGRGFPLGLDRHGNRFYHFSCDPGRIFCESSNKMWWMVYETPSHIASLVQYLHPSGLEEHSLLHAIVGLARDISRGISNRRPKDSIADVGNQSKTKYAHAKSKSLAAKSSTLVIPDWLADAEGGFVTRQLMCLGAFDCLPSAVSSCVAPGVGYSNLSLKRNANPDNAGLGAISLFATHDSHAEGDSLSDRDERLISQHWLPFFMRRRRFSNQVRLYENSLFYSGFRSLCCQAHAVNRLFVPLTSAAPTKSCFDEVLAAFKSGQADVQPHLKLLSFHTANDACIAPPVDLPGSRTNERTSAELPGIYNPIVFLKAHALRLSGIIFSVVKPSIESTLLFFSSGFECFSH